jgi:creatinine amidohydrolase/Fe(II)-dependent formamide hydrolase-like protein
MAINHPFVSPYSLSSLTSNQVKEHLQHSPCLLLPLGGMEPFGMIGSFGVNSVCIDAIAGALSQKLKLLIAPVLFYGCTSPYKSFKGSVGVKPKTFSSFLANLCNDCFFQGFEKVIILNSIEENVLALDLLVKRYNNHNVKIETFSLQSDSNIRSFVRERKPGMEMGRSEFMMLSMAAFLQPALVVPAIGESSIHFPSSNIYSTWKKRGRDPEKYRKLFPTGSSSEIAHQYDPGFGEEVFNFIVALLLNQYTPLSTTRNTNAPS